MLPGFTGFRSTVQSAFPAPPHFLVSHGIRATRLENRSRFLLFFFFFNHQFRPVCVCVPREVHLQRKVLPVFHDGAVARYGDYKNISFITSALSNTRLVPLGGSKRHLNAVRVPSDSCNIKHGNAVKTRYKPGKNRTPKRPPMFGPVQKKWQPQPGKELGKTR